MNDKYDLVIIGAGSGGLTAAGFAAQLGAKVALAERAKPGGDCTWTGCVPSKALLKAAKIAHDVRTATHFGIGCGAPVTDMNRVRGYIREAIDRVYQFETPDALKAAGIDFVQGDFSFQDPETIAAGEQRLTSKTFLLTNGARPVVPDIAGLTQVPFQTYENIFDNDHLPESMIVLGGGPIGMEIAQAYQRLGSQVTIIAEHLLPKEEPEAQEVIQGVFEREGIRIVWGRVNSVRQEENCIIASTGMQETRAAAFFVAAGRKPAVEGLRLERAGVVHSPKGIPVDNHLRTNVKHIYAAGDVVGTYQFTHFAAWQAFQAVRNALLPGSALGLTNVVPWVTFTDPEVAHVGLTENEARAKFNNTVEIRRWEMKRTDRAICENDTDGFIKLVAKRDGTILGATIVAGRAGEAITELTIAINQEIKVSDLAASIHAYPTYSTPVQQMAAEMAVEHLLSGTSGKIIKGLSKLIR